MTGDKHKPMPARIRWIEAFADGCTWHRKTGRVNTRTPSLVDPKQDARRWRRHTFKIQLSSDLKGETSNEHPQATQ